jgi:hypothetical protein
MQCIRFDHNHHLEGIQQGDHLSSDSPDEKPSGHPRGLITTGSRSSNLSSCVRYVKARPLANTLAVIAGSPRLERPGHAGIRLRIDRSTRISQGHALEDAGRRDHCGILPNLEITHLVL